MWCHVVLFHRGKKRETQLWVKKKATCHDTHTWARHSRNVAQLPCSIYQVRIYPRLCLCHTRAHTLLCFACSTSPRCDFRAERWHSWARDADSGLCLHRGLSGLVAGGPKLDPPNGERGAKRKRERRNNDEARRFAT